MEKAKCLVCGWVAYFDDDVWGECSKCGREICWRPHSPDVPKICIACYFADYNAEDTIVITPETMADLEYDRMGKDEEVEETN